MARRWMMDESESIKELDTGNFIQMESIINEYGNAMESIIKKIEIYEKISRKKAFEILKLLHTTFEEKDYTNSDESQNNKESDDHKENDDHLIDRTIIHTDTEISIQLEECISDIDKIVLKL